MTMNTREKIQAVDNSRSAMNRAATTFWALRKGVAIPKIEAGIYDGMLWLTGSVGRISEDEYFTQEQVRDALRSHGARPLTVFINSGGGYLDAGFAIFGMLKSHAQKVTVVIDGIAASSASLIAMAGDEIVMRRGSMLMIHDPSTSISGTAGDLQKTAQILDEMAGGMVDIYAGRSGKDVKAIRDLMIEETWYNADEAVANGFADRVEDLQSKVAASFDYGRVYAHAPDELTQRTDRSLSVASIYKARREALATPGVRDRIRLRAPAGRVDTRLPLV